ncbi:MAG: hypothetical protein ABEH90_08910, partial [Halolamina sp.]
QIHGLTESSYWRLLAIYLLVTALGAATIPVVRGVGPPVLNGSLVVIVLFTLLVASISALYVLYKDSQALSGDNARWSPAWWAYLGTALVVPSVSYYVMQLLFGPNAAVVAGVLLLIATTFLASLWYLYQRHVHLGVP